MKKRQRIKSKIINYEFRELKLYVILNGKMSKESQRYLRNAKDILKKAPIEDNQYADVKYVREACGTAYLAVLISIDDYLLAKGFSDKDLPNSVDGYRTLLHKHGGVHNGKLMRKFENLYRELHLAGY